MFHHEPEIVEDSEPERVLSRNPQRSVGISPQVLNPGLISSEIINLSDDEQDVLAQNISNYPISEHTKDHSFLSDAYSADCAVDGSSDEEKIVHLRRFAYSNARLSTVTTDSTTPAGASLAVERNQASNTAKPRRHKAHPVFHGLSDSHFARLTKCISCDVRWTTRKTVGQKIKHVKSCTKKNGLTVETIRIAILRETAITKASAVNDLVENEEKRACCSKTVPTTLLKNTVDTAAGKGVRHRLPRTVQCIAQTRCAILDRAKEVILHNTQITECNDSPQTATMDDDIGQLSSTQPFGQSTLGCGRVSRGELFAAAFSDVKTKNDHQFKPENSEDSFSEPAIHPARSSHKDEQWVQQFNSLILQDRDLHLSILHYEPLHFDVFKNLAKTGGLKTVALLRGFLDREAIHYYGAERTERVHRYHS